jgi:hypothetical protein
VRILPENVCGADFGHEMGEEMPRPLGPAFDKWLKIFILIDARAEAVKSSS